jgi:glycosyltransferase involved in cell wall biosynthesis
VLGAISGIRVLTFPENRGKAAALRAGFQAAEAAGFTHVITLDADGQHPVEALPAFARACREHPAAFIIGVRDLKAAGAPRRRRFSNALSTFWFKFETGVNLPDTQCGYRVYPLAALQAVPVGAGGYAFELEIMVRAAWAGVPLVAQPVLADYAAPTSQLSHFRPVRDFVRIARVHTRLAFQALWRRGSRK